MEGKSLRKIISSKMKSNRLRNILFSGVSIVFSLLFETVYTYFKTIALQTEAYGQKQNIDMVAFLLLIAVVSIFACIAYYNILHISFEGEKDFFLNINLLEQNTKRVQLVVYLHLLRLNGIGNAIGWFVGRSVGSSIAIFVLPFKTDGSSIPVSMWEILIILVWGSIVFTLGVLLPIYAIKNVKRKTTEEKNNAYFEERKKVKKVLGCPAIINLSISNLLRYNKRVFTSVILLICGVTLVNTIYIKHKSYSFDQYREQQLISSFEICGFDYENPKRYQMEEREINNFFQVNEIDKVGYVHSGKTKMPMTGRIYDRFFEYFNETFFDKLKGDEIFINEYKSIKAEKKSTVTVLGVDEFVLDKISASSIVFSGEIDKNEFSAGQSIILQGVSSDKDVNQQPFQAGDDVMLGDKTYSIMSVIDAPLTMTEINSVPGFGITLYVSKGEFERLFPDGKIEKVLFDVSPEKVEIVKNKLVDLSMSLEELNIKSERSVYSLYQREVKNSILLEAFISFALIGTGIICMINSIIDSIKERKKEFMLMKIVGAERIQIQKMLIYEGCIYSGIIVILSYIMVFLVGTVIAKFYLQQQWAGQYYFSLLPINIISPILICLGMLIPLISYEILHKN